jgi:hypothetical protein
LTSQHENFEQLAGGKQGTGLRFFVRRFLVEFKSLIFVYGNSYSIFSLLGVHILKNSQPGTSSLSNSILLNPSRT